MKNKTDNRSVGGRFEQELARKLADAGFWVHVLQQNKAGQPADIIVAFDDISLDVGKLRLRNHGSAGGHNGIKSIIANLKSEEFKRVRVGIGDKPKGSDLADYVLGRFSGSDAILMDEAYSRAADAIAEIISNGIDAAMNEYN